MSFLSLIEILKSNFDELDWTLPQNIEFAVLTSNSCFKLGKIKAVSPQTLAENFVLSITEFFQKNNLPYQIEAKNGYLNINLDWESNATAELVNDIMNWKKNNFGLEQSPSKVLFEFVGLNVAKPMHAGHLMNICIGEGLRRILKTKYPNLVTQNHLGDWGVNMGIVLWAWKEIADKTVELDYLGERISLNLKDFDNDPVETMVKAYVWGNQQKEGFENWDVLVRNEFTKLENGDLQNRELWQSFVEKSVSSLDDFLELFGVPKFDYIQGESFYENELNLLTDWMDKHDLWEKEGKGRFFDMETLAKNWQNLPSRQNLSEEDFKKISGFGRSYLIQSKNGYSTYIFRDVGARFQWAKTIQAEKMITLTDFTQSHNFNQAFSIISYLSDRPEFQELADAETQKRLNLKNLVHVPYGFLKLTGGKMSTRKGEFLRASDLYQEVRAKVVETLAEKSQMAEDEETVKILTVSAIKWTILSKDRLTDVTFDIQNLLKFEGNTGIYQLYTLVRLQSILKKANFQNLQKIDFTKLNEQEKLILKKTLIIPFVVDQITENYKLHTLTNVIFEICTLINQWYGQHSVSQEVDIDRKNTLLNLCYVLISALNSSLSLLGIETVKEM